MYAKVIKKLGKQKRVKRKKKREGKGIGPK
jgi:hypothetical protein